MNFKKNFKRFFTLSRSTEGFTLVELIVVIAILGILVGVGMPAYAGYVEKAGQSTDDYNLAMMSNVFAVACIENGVDPAAVTAVAMEWSNEGKIFKGLTQVTRTQTDDPIVTSFNANLGNAIEFKVYTKGDVKFSGGKFFAGAVGTYKGQSIAIPQSAINAYKNSNWGDVPAEDVLGMIDQVTNMAGAIDNATFNAMLADPDYNAACAEALGYKSTEEYKKAITDMTNAAIADYKAKNPNADQTAIDDFQTEYETNLVLNTAVLVAAKNAQNNSSSIMATLTAQGGTTAKSSIKDAMVNDPANGLSQAALAYGLYTSYKMETDPNFKPSETPDVLDALNAMDDPEFQNYLTKGNGQKDLDGYVAALGTAGNNAGNGVGTDIIVNGFGGNEDLKGLLESIMGNTTTTTPEE